MKKYEREQVIYEIISLLKYHSKDKICLKFANLLINKATNEKDITLSTEEIKSYLFKEESPEINFIIFNILRHLKADFTGISFDNKNISGLNFIGIENVSINLNNVLDKNLTNTTFNGVKLEGNLDNAKIDNTNFSGYIGDVKLDPQKVKDKSIRGSSLAGITVIGSLDDIEISGVDFTEVKGEVKINPQKIPKKQLYNINFKDTTLCSEDDKEPSFEGCTIYDCKFNGIKKDIIINLDEVESAFFPKLAICDLTGVTVIGKAKSNYEAKHCVKEDGSVIFENVKDDLFGSYYYDKDGNYIHVYLYESTMWDKENSRWKYIPRSEEENLKIDVKFKEPEKPKQKFFSRFRRRG